MTEKDEKYHNHAWALGFGSSDQLDTYLSPQSYTGWQVKALYETIRLTSMANSRISFQSLSQATFSRTMNRSGSSTYLGANICYDAGWHYNWTPTDKLRILAGAMIGTKVGILHHSSNGNNPAQVRFNFGLSASLMAIYHLNIRKNCINIRYQANMPGIGIMFSPQYGQSYYEIGQGNRDHNICCSYPGNAFCLWQQLTIDIPISNYTTLRTGYLCDTSQSHVNNIKIHDWSHSVMLGLVFQFKKIKREERNNAIL